MTLFEQLQNDALVALDADYDALMHLSASEISEFQLYWVRRRFNELLPQVAILEKLAAEQGIAEIRTLDDLPPLLFSHKVYKS